LRQVSRLTRGSVSRCRASSCLRACSPPTQSDDFAAFCHRWPAETDPRVIWKLSHLHCLHCRAASSDAHRRDSRRIRVILRQHAFEERDLIALERNGELTLTHLIWLNGGRAPACVSHTPESLRLSRTTRSESLSPGCGTVSDQPDTAPTRFRGRRRVSVVETLHPMRLTSRPPPDSPWAPLKCIRPLSDAIPNGPIRTRAMRRVQNAPPADSRLLQTHPVCGRENKSHLHPDQPTRNLPSLPRFLDSSKPRTVLASLTSTCCGGVLILSIVVR